MEGTINKFIYISLASALGTIAFGQNLVLNPGFETGDFTNWSSQSASSGSLFFVNGPSGGYNANTGNFAAQFGAVSGIDDVIFQTLNTVAGATYTYSLWYHGGGSPEDLNVYWNTSTFSGTGNVFSGTVLNDGAWTQLVFTETATGTSTVIGIGSNDSPSYTSVDDVSVVRASPEPISMIAFGAGAFALIRRRRNRS